MGGDLACRPSRRLGRELAVYWICFSRIPEWLWWSALVGVVQQPRVGPSIGGRGSRAVKTEEMTFAEERTLGHSHSGLTRRGVPIQASR